MDIIIVGSPSTQLTAECREEKSGGRNRGADVLKPDLPNGKTGFHVSEVS
jgi:hypothetical protein